MIKLLCLLGILFPIICCAQNKDADIIPASDVKESTVYYVENSEATADISDSPRRRFGGFHVELNSSFKAEINKSSDKFWVWVAFGITSFGIIGLMLVFNKLKKNLNDTY